MADPFQRLIEIARQHEPTLTGMVSTQWSSAEPAARALIRESLARELQPLSKSELTEISNLEIPPRPQFWSASVAHTQGLGGWVAAHRPTSVGWDVEVSNRISSNILARICSPQELRESAFTPGLWGAKESYFKALENRQPKVITELTIVNWTAVSENAWRWEGRGPTSGIGFSLNGEGLIYACCLIVRNH